MVSMHVVHEHSDEGWDEEVEGDKDSCDYGSCEDMGLEGVE